MNCRCTQHSAERQRGKTPSGLVLNEKDCRIRPFRLTSEDDVHTVLVLCRLVPQ